MYPEDNITMVKRILNYFHCSKLKFVFLQVKLPNLLQIIFCNRLIKNESREAVVRPEVFYRKGVLGNFTKFTGKHLCQSTFLIKLQILGNFN